MAAEFRRNLDYVAENQAILCVAMIGCKIKSTILYLSQITTPMTFVSTRSARQRYQLIKISVLSLFSYFFFMFLRTNFLQHPALRLSMLFCLLYTSDAADE